MTSPRFAFALLCALASVACGGMARSLSGTGDRDADGVPDDVDACPEMPEDFDRFDDADGCPDPDNDRDGILDVDDGCPNSPEDKDGFEDTDGCPEANEADRDS